MTENDSFCTPRSCKCKAIALSVLAIGVALGGFFPGYFYYKTHLASNFVTVKGLAEMDVRADLAVWDLRVVVTGNQLTAVQNDLNRQREEIHAFLAKRGFTTDEIADGRVETNDLKANPYRSETNDDIRYILQQSVKVRSTNVTAVESALSSTGDLIAKGIVFDSQSYGSPVSYIFTRLNDIKPEMLEKATKNATAAAAEFAKSSGSKVGKIRRAQQGVFSILPREETSESESAQIDKKVRVVSTVEFWLD